MIALVIATTKQKWWTHHAIQGLYQKETIQGHLTLYCECSLPIQLRNGAASAETMQKTAPQAPKNAKYGAAGAENAK